MYGERGVNGEYGDGIRDLWRLDAQSVCREGGGEGCKEKG